METDRVPALAFLEIHTRKDEWKLDQAVWAALKPHIPNELTLDLYLAWPPEMLPDKGDEVELSGVLLLSNGKAGETSFMYSKERGAVAYVEVSVYHREITSGARSHDLRTLQELAAEGFLFGPNSSSSIHEVLKTAGLLPPGA